MSEAPEPPVTHSVTAAMQGLRDAVERLGVVSAAGADGELWTMPGPDLLEETTELHRLLCAADAVLHGMVREIDTRGAATAKGAPTTQAWLRERLHLHPGAAKRLVATARALHDDPSGALVHHAEPDEVPAPGGRAVLAAAFAAGAISGEHAAVACQTLAELPAEVASGMVAEAETYLCAEAARRDPKVLAKLARHLSHVLDPEAGDTLAENEDHDRATQELHVRQRADGGSDVRARFGAELTAEFLSQLQPLAGPRPTCDDRPDMRTVAQRNADALAELLRRSAIAGTTPARHGSRATITVSMALETLERRLGAPGATLDWSGPISAETARRLACDAQVIPVATRQLWRAPRRRACLLPGHPGHLAGLGSPRRRLLLRHLRSAAGVDRSPSPDPLGGRRRDLGCELLPVLRLPPPPGPSWRLGRRADRRRHPRHPAALGRSRARPTTQPAPRPAH